MPLDEPRENAMNALEQLGEAFQLGSVLAEIRTTLGHNTGVLERTDRTVTEMSTRLGNLEVSHGRQSEQIHTVFSRLEQLEQRPADHVSRAEFIGLKEDVVDISGEVKSSRLTWGKIAALIGSFGGITVILLFTDRIIPG